MSVSALWKIFAVQIDAAADIFFTGITNQSVNPGVQKVLQSGDGRVDNIFVAAGKVQPLATFTSTQIKTVIDTCGIIGKKIDATNILKIYFQQYDLGGTRKTGSTLMMMTVNSGLLVPTTITLEDGQPGEAALELHAVWDGTNKPFVISTGVAAPAAPIPTEFFTTGPIQLNGVATEGVQTITLDFGNSVIKKGGDGEVYDTFVAIDKRAPKITYTLTDVTLANTQTIDGVGQSASDSIVYFTKMAAGGTRVADVTAEHIKITIDDGYLCWLAAQGADEGPADLNEEIQPVWDGTADVLVFNTASAIT